MTGFVEDLSNCNPVQNHAEYRGVCATRWLVEGLLSVVMKNLQRGIALPVNRALVSGPAPLTIDSLRDARWRSKMARDCGVPLTSRSSIYPHHPTDIVPQACQLNYAYSHSWIIPIDMPLGWRCEKPILFHTTSTKCHQNNSSIVNGDLKRLGTTIDI